MPKVTRSTRLDSTRQKEKSQEQGVDHPHEITTNTATNSKPDLDAQDYKLHFELTDLEPTNPPTDSEDRQEHIESGPNDSTGHLKVGQSDLQPSSPHLSEHQEQVIGVDKDGIGEPDYNYDSSNLHASSYDPALIEERQLATRSTPPHRVSHHEPSQNQVDGSSHFFPSTTTHLQHQDTSEQSFPSTSACTSLRNC
jgi:hypothetical protein